MPLKTTLLIAVAAALWFAAPVPLAAQDAPDDAHKDAAGWPARPVKIVVPFGPGSTPDIVARILADGLQQRLGQPVVVEDRPGGSGNTGTAAVAKAAPDGYTLGVSIAGPLAINALLFARLPYDPARDFAHVTLLATQPSVLAVNARVPAGTAGELVTLLTRSPGRLSFGSIGTGSVSHLAMAAIALAAGAQLVHIPYASSPEAITALMRGDVDIVCLPAAAVAPQLAAAPGRPAAIRVLAVTTASRSALVPGVPTLKESGIDVEVDSWNGLVAPAGTPAAVVDRIAREVSAVMTADGVRARLATQLMEPVTGTPAEFRARIEDDLARWGAVIRAARIAVD